jgi:hypothetical protein
MGIHEVPRPASPFASSHNSAISTVTSFLHAGFDPNPSGMLHLLDSWIRNMSFMEVTGTPGEVPVNGDKVVLDLILGILWIKNPGSKLRSGSTACVRDLL